MWYRSKPSNQTMGRISQHKSAEVNLPAVEHGPGDLPGVPLQHMSLVGAGRQELVALAISLDQGAAMARVDLVARVAAQVDLHPNPLLLLLRSVIKLFKL